MSRIYWIIGLLLFIFFLSCLQDKKEVQDKSKSNYQGAVLSGELLSRQYCQSCHLYPEPHILDKRTWERSVLPLMGRRLGIYEKNITRDEIINGAINIPLVIQQNIFPEKQLIGHEEWQAITEYYILEAPDWVHSITKEETAFRPLQRFEIIKPLKGVEPINTTMVKVDVENSYIYIGLAKGKSGSLMIMNIDFEILDEIELTSPPTDIHIEDNWLVVTLIGSLRLMPSNNQFGELVYFFRNPGDEKYSPYESPITVLTRPVQTLYSDFGNNGLDDILIAEFGYYTGSLSLFRNSTEGNLNKYEKHILKDIPGTVKIQIEDMNRDGHKDIVALFAQGDEGISIFYGDGLGGFKEERVLRFSPSFGSVYFELVDMNDDGYLDILYCNGDNGDYRPVLKDYHGIRVFENDGKNNFNQVYFYPMHGAFKASAVDFNLDGNLDIFAVAYFPDALAQKRRDLVYLKGNGGYSFSSQFLEKDISARWVTFDIEDINGDGYPDILLGALGGYQKENRENGNFYEEVNSIIFFKNRGN